MFDVRVFFREIFAFIRQISVFLISRNRVKRNFGIFSRANEMRKNNFRETISPLRYKFYVCAIANVLIPGISGNYAQQHASIPIKKPNGRHRQPTG